MNEYEAFRKIEQKLRSTGVSCRFGYRPADDLIVRDTFFVALDCDGGVRGEVRGAGDDLETAFHIAMAQREDMLGRQVAA